MVQGMSGPGRAWMSAMCRTAVLVLLCWLTACAGPSSQLAPVVRPGGGDYIVKRGDNLHGIAFQYGVRVQDVVAWNQIRNPDLIHPGQRLRMSPPASRRGTAPVVVRKQTRAPLQPVVVDVVPPVRATGRTVSPAKASTPATVVSKVSPAQTKTVKHPPMSAGKVGAAASVVTVVHDGLRWTRPTPGRIIKGFRASSEGKKGLNIAGSAGQTIVAAAAGKIVYSGSGLRGYGQLIIIEHNKKYLSAYAHNSVLNAKEGDRVALGQPIAEMGKTGTSRVMLHFEIRRDGKAVDPARYLPAPNP